MRNMEGLYLGIDPGKLGAWAAVNEKAELIEWGMYDEIEMPVLPDCRLAILEKVGAMPGQGVVSMFNFGRSVGIWEGRLQALEIPFETVTPQKWMKEVVDVVPSDRKQRKEYIAKFIARRFPEISKELSLKKNQGLADAVCIALYCVKRGMP